MLFALDKNGNRVYIDDALKSEEFFCPCCGGKLVLRLGQIRIHHFAHPYDSTCRDSWHYDMSEWHIDWQNKFPKEQQEVVKVLDGQKHRADVLIEQSKVVYEFQHSPLSSDEFDDRNSFYNKLGYKVIWVFDVQEQDENGQLDNYRSDLWSWNRPRRTLDFFNPKDKSVEVYLQMDCEDDIGLVKVTWCADEGMTRFATDGYWYSDKDLVHKFDPKNIEGKDTCKLSELYDKLLVLNSEDHSTYYFGCPISTTHKCVNSRIDTPTNEYKNIMPCMECKYCCNDEDYNPICKKRFLDLNLSGDLQVKILKRNKNGFISRISFLNDEEKEETLDIPSYECDGAKNIFELWKENNYECAVFKNIRTSKFVRISRNPQEQYYTYHKVYGYFSKDGYNWSRDSYELYDVEKPEWICTWCRK